jgi:hypothetical protein
MTKPAVPLPPTEFGRSTGQPKVTALASRGMHRPPARFPTAHGELLPRLPARPVPVVQRAAVAAVAPAAAVAPVAAAVAAPAVVAPALILSTLPHAPTEGYCGTFERSRLWVVTNLVAGVIIQEINRAFNVLNARTGAALAGAALDGYVRNPNSSVNATELRYWELWEVDAHGAVSDGSIDTWGLPSLILWNGRGRLNFARYVRNTTRGAYVMTGSARFCAGLAVPAAFVASAVANAGTLRATVADPTAALPASTSGPVNHQVTVTWDSRPGAGRSPYSRVV